MIIKYNGQKNAELEKTVKPGDKVAVVFGGKIWTQAKVGAVVTVNKNSFRVQIDGTKNKVTVPKRGQKTYSPYNCIMPISQIECSSGLIKVKRDGRK